MSALLAPRAVGNSGDRLHRASSGLLRLPFS
ncbi:hypothetical protein ABID81_000901 [Frigoribacterium sp. PvP054]